MYKKTHNKIKRLRVRRNILKEQLLNLEEKLQNKIDKINVSIWKLMGI